MKDLEKLDLLNIVQDIDTHLCDCGKPLIAIKGFAGKDAYFKCSECVAIADAKQKQEAINLWQSDKYRNIYQTLKRQGVQSRYCSDAKKDFICADKKYIASEVWEAIQPIFKGESLFIFGENGRGKTFLSVCIMKELILRDAPVFIRDSLEIKSQRMPIFRNTIKLLQHLRSPFAGGKATEQEIQDIYINASVLSVDDIGKEGASDYALRSLFSIIDERYGNGDPVIFTSNFSDKQLEQKYNNSGDLMGSSILSRVMEMCNRGDNRIELLGEDRRFEFCIR